jgi:hypothetical protein
MPPRRRAGRGSGGEQAGDNRVEGERDSATDSTDGNNNNSNSNNNDTSMLSTAAALTTHDTPTRGRGEGHGRPAERVAADGASSSSPVAGLVALAGLGRLGSSPSSGPAPLLGGHERRGADTGGPSGRPSAPRGPDQRNVVDGVPVMEAEGDGARGGDADAPAQHEQDPVKLAAEGRPSAKRAKPKPAAAPATAAGRAKPARSDTLASPKQIQLGAPAASSLQQGKAGRLPAPHPLRYGAAARGTVGGAKAEPLSAPSPLANFGRPSSHFAPAGTVTATPSAGGHGGYAVAGMGTPERRPVPQFATNSPAAAAGVVPGMTGASRSASTSPSKSFAQRHEARLRGTGSPRIGFQDKARSRRSSLQEEDDDDDDEHLWTRYIDRDEPRFYISQMAGRAIPLVCTHGGSRKERKGSILRRTRRFFSRLPLSSANTAAPSRICRTRRQNSAAT